MLWAWFFLLENPEKLYFFLVLRINSGRIIWYINRSREDIIYTVSGWLSDDFESRSMHAHKVQLKIQIAVYAKHSFAAVKKKHAKGLLISDGMLCGWTLHIIVLSSLWDIQHLATVWAVWAVLSVLSDAIFHSSIKISRHGPQKLLVDFGQLTMQRIILSNLGIS